MHIDNTRCVIFGQAAEFLQIFTAADVQWLFGQVRSLVVAVTRATGHAPLARFF